MLNKERLKLEDKETCSGMGWSVTASWPVSRTELQTGSADGGMSEDVCLIKRVWRVMLTDVTADLKERR